MRAAGWAVGPSVTNFILVDFGSPERADRRGRGAAARGLVPRTFPAGHPLAGILRLTVRDPDENDRLIDAATEIAAALRTRVDRRRRDHDRHDGAARMTHAAR